jgi:hypothetical protein
MNWLCRKAVGELGFKMINIRHLIGSLPDKGEFQVIRKALESLAKESVTASDVRAYVTGTEFGFKTTTNESGEEVVRLDDSRPALGIDRPPLAGGIPEG